MLVEEEPAVVHSDVVPSMWVLYLCQPKLPLASQFDTLRQVRDILSQRIVGIHLYGSVAGQSQVEIIRHDVSKWDWATGNPTHYSTEPSTDYRILVTCCQVVNAYQDDRVQDDDLTQKHYLLSRTHGIEQMQRSAVLLALCVSTVLFFYDGGGSGGGSGEVLCYRLVCHCSNEVTTDARLDFIANERLGIDPAVEFGGVAVPLHQSFRSSTYFAALQYRFHAVHFIDGYRHLLQLWFVEGAVQHFSEIVDQSVHGWIGDVNLVYGDHLFAPIRHVAFFEQSLELTDAHAVGHTELGHALTVVKVQTLPNLFLILCIHL